MLHSKNAASSFAVRGTGGRPHVRSWKVAEISFTVDANMQLRGMVGLRDRARHAVLEVLESALEIRKLGMAHVHKDAPLLIRVGPYLVTYSLDLESDSATIWGAEPVRQSAA
jgi:hypothetical protein